MSGARQGPLAGLKVLELAGLGPAPVCGMLLSDLGADVVRIDRPGAKYDRFSVEMRGRRSVAIDLKGDPGRETALRLIERADLLIEGYEQFLDFDPATCRLIEPLRFLPQKLQIQSWAFLKASC